MYPRFKVGIWGLTQGCGGPFKFWGWNRLFWGLSHKAPWLSDGRSGKKFDFWPSVSHKVAKTSVIRNFWILTIFSLKRAGPWFRPFFTAGHKIPPAPHIFRVFIRSAVGTLCEPKHMWDSASQFSVFLRYRRIPKNSYWLQRAKN